MKLLPLLLLLASTLVSAQTATSKANVNTDGTVTITTVYVPPVVVTPPPPPPSSEGTTVSNLQADTSRWQSFGQHGPDYVDCHPSGCEGISWSMKTGITSPSLSNNATRFDLGGTTTYGDALFNAAAIGSRAANHDSSHALLPTLHNYVYDTDVYVVNVAVVHALEFDVSVWMGATAGMTFGTQCSPMGDKDWDIYNNSTGAWQSTSKPCNLVNGWNHVTLALQRTASNGTLYKSIALNGATMTLNTSYPSKVKHADWWGINVNFQMDGDAKPDAYTAYLDNLSLTYF